jgi:hypothetical protein
VAYGESTARRSRVPLVIAVVVGIALVLVVRLPVVGGGSSQARKPAPHQAARLHRPGGHRVVGEGSPVGADRRLL